MVAPSLIPGQLSIVAIHPPVAAMWSRQKTVRKGISSYQGPTQHRPTPRHSVLQMGRQLHINATSKTDNERRITVPRSQAGQALQAIRETSLPARRFQSTSVQHTSVCTELPQSTICAQCKDKLSASNAQSPEQKAEEEHKASKSKDETSMPEKGLFCMLMALFALSSIHSLK